MKLLILIFIVLFSIYSCKDSKTKKFKTEREKQEEESIERLSDQKEKIVLLSEIRRISYDTLYLVLIDYYAITSDYINSSDSSRFYSKKAIDLIS